MRILWSSQTASEELLAVLPFLNPLIAKGLRAEMEDDTTVNQIRTLAKKRQVCLQAAGPQVQMTVVQIAIPALHRVLDWEPNSLETDNA